MFELFKRLGMMTNKKWFIVLFIIVFICFEYKSNFLGSIIQTNYFHYQFKLKKELQDKNVYAYWNMDDSDIEEFITGDIAHNYGVSLYQGKFNKGRAFNSTVENQIITKIPINALNQSYSLSMYINLNNSNLTQPLMHLYDGKQRNGLILVDGQIQFLIPTINGFETIQYSFENYKRWVQIVGVYDHATQTASLYENGKLKARNKILNFKQINRSIKFGRFQEIRVYYPVSGVIDEVVFWKKSLSDKEVDHLFKTNKSLLQYLARSYYYKWKIFVHVRYFYMRLVKFFDYLNPAYDLNHLYQKNIPVLNFVLSNSDNKYFQKQLKKIRKHGNTNPQNLKSRKIQINYQNQRIQAAMSLFLPNSLYWNHSKPTFRVEINDDISVFNTKRLLLTPPEISGYVLPFLSDKIFNYLNLNSKNHNLAFVKFNRNTSGIYMVSDFDSFFKKLSQNIPENYESLVINEKSLNKMIKEIDQDFIDIYLNDLTSPLNSNQIKMQIDIEKKIFISKQKLLKQLSKKQKFEKMIEYFKWIILSDDNPALDYIVSDLDLPQMTGQGEQLFWNSSVPSLINQKGELFREKTSSAQEVYLSVMMKSKNSELKYDYKLRVIPFVENELSSPILKINVNHDINNDSRVYCQIEFIENQIKNTLGSKTAFIKFRGNSVLKYPKKCFSIHKQEAFKIFDFDNSKTFYLNSSFVDHTFIKNKLTYDLFNSFRDESSNIYAPKVHHVDIILNGKYYGLGEILERVDRHLLDFDAYNEKNTKYDSIYKAKGGGSNFKKFSISSYVQIEPNNESVFYMKPLEDLINWIGLSSPQQFDHEIENWVDIRNIIDFQILVNFALSQDGYKHNLYLAKRKGENSPFFIIPWDYDSSYFIKKNIYLKNYLFDKLMKYKSSYKDQLKERWFALRQNQLNIKKINKRINFLKKQLEHRVLFDYIRWGQSHRLNYNLEVKKLKQWIRERLKYLDGYYSKI